MAPAPTAPNERHLLFIGNSLTAFQNGIYTHLTALAAAAHPPLQLHSELSLKGGATLETHWKGPTAQKLISSGTFDAVFLQEDLPETTLASFHEYARKFTDLIQTTRARPILLMTWPYERLRWISLDTIAAAHRDAETQLSAEIAPVALAWDRCRRERPGLDLFVADREHPSLAGTYLASCVCYATLFRSSPNGLAYLPAGLLPLDAAHLQGCAWETYQEWKT